MLLCLLTYIKYYFSVVISVYFADNNDDVACVNNNNNNNNNRRKRDEVVKHIQPNVTIRRKSFLPRDVINKEEAKGLLLSDEDTSLSPAKTQVVIVTDRCHDDGNDDNEESSSEADTTVQPIGC